LASWKCVVSPICPATFPRRTAGGQVGVITDGSGGYGRLTGSISRVAGRAAVGTSGGVCHTRKGFDCAASCGGTAGCLLTLTEGRRGWNSSNIHIRICSNWGVARTASVCSALRVRCATGRDIQSGSGSVQIVQWTGSVQVVGSGGAALISLAGISILSAARCGGTAGCLITLTGVRRGCSNIKIRICRNCGVARTASVCTALSVRRATGRDIQSG